MSFDAPLQYDHDQRNDSVTDRPDLTLPIAVKERNIENAEDVRWRVSEDGPVRYLAGEIALPTLK